MSEQRRVVVTFKADTPEQMQKVLAWFYEDIDELMSELARNDVPEVSITTDDSKEQER